MKIAHIITSLSYGGAEKLLSDTLPIYKSMGVDVELIVFNGTRTAFMTQLEEAGIKIISFSKQGSPYNPLYILKLIKLIGKYDIVHTHNYSPQIFVALASLFAYPCLFTTEHSTTNRRRKNILFKLLDRWMYSRYTGIICISSATKQALMDYLPDISKVVVVENGIDVKRYEKAVADTSLRRGADKIVTMVGGFRKQKDQDTLIRAIKELSGFNVRLLLAGDGERHEELIRVVEQLDLNNKVKFLGNRSDVPIILKSSDVVVQSSHYEGFGLAALEGMAAGKPVIASDVPGLADVVKDAGLLFPSGDFKCLARLLTKLLSDADYYKSVAERCMARSKEYDVSVMAKRYAQLYNEALL